MSNKWIAHVELAWWDATSAQWNSDYDYQQRDWPCDGTTLEECILEFEDLSSDDWREGDGGGFGFCVLCGHERDPEVDNALLVYLCEYETAEIAEAVEEAVGEAVDDLDIEDSNLRVQLTFREVEE